MNKIIFDPIHGIIELDPICIKIIDTPEFQRLRFIKQLGPVFYVFPSANHTRFEHSIGVCYLAGEMIHSLKEKQPELEITKQDILNIKIAGLCHDLGHGPFSHSFDSYILDTNKPFRHHEYRSCIILHHIIKKYNIELEETEIVKIKDLIYPDGSYNLNKKFLYQIVANDKNGIDVDKFDYLKRDTYYLGLKYNCDYSRIIKLARVINDEICFPKKLIFNLYEIFYTRTRLHQQVYSHPVCKSIEFMIVDILIDMNKEIDFNKCVENIDEFCKLNDNILTIADISKGFNKSKKLIKDIHCRNLYKYIGDIETSEIEVHKNNPNSIIDTLEIGISDSFLENVKFYDKDMNKSFNIDPKFISNLLLNFGVKKINRVYLK